MSEEPANLRLLRRLVTTLMVVMILGLLTIVALFVIRFADSVPPQADFPNALALPQGETAAAFTKGDGWYAVVTRSGQILIYNGGGELTRTIAAPQADD
ncbi:MAG: hypothetical protein GDA53_03360 [Rhodobacteraceae bacterium]|nr:hypothetical protein [Paracoccaceae bacterium]